VIATRLGEQRELGLPFTSWTWDPQEISLGEQGMAMKRRRIDEILFSGGLPLARPEGKGDHRPLQGG
jgi:hypothetical protein